MRWPTFKDRDAGGRFILEAATFASSALFAGAALYISLVEHPARKTLAASSLDVPKSKGKAIKKSAIKSAVLQWRESYQRAAPLQVFYALVAGVGGMCNTFVLKEAAAWAWGGGLVAMNVPFTLLCLMPINKELGKRAEMAELEQETRGTSDREEETKVEEEQVEEADPVSRRVTFCLGSWSCSGLPSTKHLLRLWGQLHAVRAVLGLSGFLVLTAHILSVAHSRRASKVMIYG